MKRIAICAAVALSAGMAHADPVQVLTPKAPISAEAAQSYVAELERAVEVVCRDAAAPVLGLNFYLYRDCLKQTRAEVAKNDPTGLYASRDSAPDLQIAAK